MRHKILYAFEAAEREPDPDRRRAWLTFVIVGAGPTGVELAGALAEIARDTLRHDFRSIHPEESRILLLDGSPHVLPTYPEDLSAGCGAIADQAGRAARDQRASVTGIDPEGVTLETPERKKHIDARTVLWAAGVTASDFGKVLERPRRAARSTVRDACWLRRI